MNTIKINGVSTGKMLALELEILRFINDQPSSYSYKYAYLSTLRQNYAPQNRLLLLLDRLTKRGILFMQPQRNACCPGYWKITPDGHRFLEQHKNINQSDLT